MGHARLRPGAVAQIATETTIAPPGSQPIADPSARAAVQSLQRTVDVLAAPAKVAASHPTLRDQIVPASLATGTNWIDHGLGRAPRFVYVALLALPAETWVAWAWVRQDGDSDRSRVRIDLATGAASGPLAALVRLE